MSKRTYLIGLASCLFALANLVGCGGSGEQPDAASQDELTSYLDEHPELKELEVVDPSDDIGSATDAQ